MNPFDNLNENNKDININNNIEIWIEQNKKKKITNILGWLLTTNELKEHIKIIKKKNGCNGAIKKILINEIENNVIIFQGDHIDYVKNYLIDLGIDKNDIIIKG